MNETRELPASHVGAEVRPRGAAARLAEGLEGFIDWIGRIAAWIGFGLVIAVALNVTLRYLFSQSQVWLQELEWHLISPIVMIGVAYALRHREHVRVDLFYERFPPWLQHLIDLTVALTIVVISVVLIYVSMPWVLQAYRIGEGSPDPGGLPYRFLLKAFVPFGFLLLLIQSVADGIRHALLLFNR